MMALCDHFNDIKSISQAIFQINHQRNDFPLTKLLKVKEITRRLGTVWGYTCTLATEQPSHCFRDSFFSKFSKGLTKVVECRRDCHLIDSNKAFHLVMQGPAIWLFYAATSLRNPWREQSQCFGQLWQFCNNKYKKHRGVGKHFCYDLWLNSLSE